MDEKLILLIFSIPLLFSFLVIRYLKTQKKKGILKLVSFIHVGGMNELAKGIDVLISFEANIVKIDDIKIPITAIDRFEFSSSKQLIKKDKSVVGRAIVGGALMGGVGAVVGGLSGINNGNQVTKLIHYLTINFSEGNQAVFSFNNDSDRFNVENAIKRINRM